MTEFNPTNRTPDANWFLAQIDLLVRSAKEFKDSSLVIYAALETRNLLERIEFELLAMATIGSNSEKFIEDIRGKTGIHKMNKKYHSLKYRYQSFSSAATRAIFDVGALKPFSYKTSEKYCSELSQYIHSYSRFPEELIFGSTFIESGIKLIEDAVSYLKTNYFVNHEGGFIYGTFDFNSLTPSVQEEFNKWLNGTDMDEEALFQRLSYINEVENGGLKTRISLI